MAERLIEYATPERDEGAVWVAWLAEASAFGGFALMLAVLFGVSAVPVEWLAWVIAVSLVGLALAGPVWMARVAERRAARERRADRAGRAMRLVRRARRSALMLLVLAALTLAAFGHQVASFREAREAAAERLRW
jgi:hypothetical protein